MNDRHYKARMVIIGMSPETRRILNEKWPEWREHITEIEVSTSVVVRARQFLDAVSPLAIELATMSRLKQGLAQELASRIEPMMEIVELPELWHMNTGPLSG